MMNRFPKIFRQKMLSGSQSMRHQSLLLISSNHVLPHELRMADQLSRYQRIHPRIAQGAWYHPAFFPGTNQTLYAAIG